MALYTKCMKCGGWKAVPENPVADDALSTGMMMNMPEAPKNPCTCDDKAAAHGTP